MTVVETLEAATAVDREEAGNEKQFKVNSLRNAPLAIGERGVLVPRYPHIKKRFPTLVPHTIRMRYGKLFGWGIVIYAVAFLTWSIFIAYGISGGIIPKAASLLILMVVSAIAGRSLHFSSWQDILPYSFIWALIIAALDGLMAVPFVGWKIYAELGVWIGYMIVITVPLFFTDEPLSASEELKKHLS